MTSASSRGPHPLVDPRGRVPVRSRLGFAPRSPAEAGMVVGFLVNEQNRQTGQDFTAFSEAIERSLRMLPGFPPFAAIRHAKPVLSRPADDDLLARFRECRGVVTGLAK